MFSVYKKKIHGILVCCYDNAEIKLNTDSFFIFVFCKWYPDRNQEKYIKYVTF